MTYEHKMIHNHVQAHAYEHVCVYLYGTHDVGRPQPTRMGTIAMAYADDSFEFHLFDFDAYMHNDNQTIQSNPIL